MWSFKTSHDEDEVGSILTAVKNVLLVVEYTSEKLFYIVPLEDSLFLVLFCRCFSISHSSQSLKMVWVNEVKFRPSFQPFFFSRCCLFLHLCSPLAFPSCSLSLSVLQWFVVCVCLSEALFLNLVSCLHMQISKSSYKAVYYCPAFHIGSTPVMP